MLAVPRTRELSIAPVIDSAVLRLTAICRGRGGGGSGLTGGQLAGRWMVASDSASRIFLTYVRELLYVFNDNDQP